MNSLKIGPDQLERMLNAIAELMDAEDPQDDTCPDWLLQRLAQARWCRHQSLREVVAWAKTHGVPAVEM